MKNLFLLVFLAFIFTLSCSKDDIDTCKDVNYEEYFKIEPNHKYCFPDGNFIKVTELRNDFCPCLSNCIWEGEMNLHYIAQINGVEFIGKTGSSSKTDSTIESKLLLEYKNLSSEGECDVEILSIEIRVTVL